MTVTVIIPVYNGSETLDRCLGAMLRSTVQPDAVIVADDSSTDGSGELARAFGMQTIRLENGPHGPAAARNCAAHAATSDLLVFLDADVEVQPDSIARLIAPLFAQCGAAACFGSYDDAPEGQSIAARYGNLRHHFVHQQGARDASTFWSGFGAIRRELFFEVGGFDQAFGTPSVEDIELGLRLRAGGQKIVLVHDAQAKHLKNWTLLGLWKTDIFRRAIPWSRLIMNHKTLPDDLNVGWSERFSAVSINLALLAIVFAALAPLAIRPALIVAALTLVVVWQVLNRHFLTLLARKGGLPLLLGGGTLHMVYHAYSSAVFGLVWLNNAARSLIVHRTGVTARTSGPE